LERKRESQGSDESSYPFSEDLIDRSLSINSPVVLPSTDITLENLVLEAKLAIEDQSLFDTPSTSVSKVTYGSQRGRKVTKTASPTQSLQKKPEIVSPDGKYKLTRAKVTREEENQPSVPKTLVKSSRTPDKAVKMNDMLHKDEISQTEQTPATVGDEKEEAKFPFNIRANEWVPFRKRGQVRPSEAQNVDGFLKDPTVGPPLPKMFHSGNYIPVLITEPEAPWDFYVTFLFVL